MSQGDIVNCNSLMKDCHWQAVRLSLKYGVSISGRNLSSKHKMHQPGKFEIRLQAEFAREWRFDLAIVGAVTREEDALEQSLCGKKE